MSKAFVASIFCFALFQSMLTLPAADAKEIADAQEQKQNYNFQALKKPLDTTRGKLTSVDGGGYFLGRKDSCNFTIKEFGWSPDSCSSIDLMVFEPVPEIDTLIVKQPVDDGYVKLDDWNNSTASGSIEDLTRELKEALEAQSKKLGFPIEFQSWKILPTVDKELGISYYADLTKWDGDPVINAKISVLDRYGYVELMVVPADSAISDEALRQVIKKAVGLYQSTPGNKYSEYSKGDKIASYGALGVFAALLGLKFGKAATAGLVAFGLIFLKKVGVVLLLPFIWMIQFFSRIWKRAVSREDQKPEPEDK